MDPGDLLATVQDPDGTRHICPPIHPIMQAKQLQHNRMRYLRMRSVIFDYSIKMVKEDLHRFRNSSQAEKGPSPTLPNIRPAIGRKRKREIATYHRDERGEEEEEEQEEQEEEQEGEDDNCRQDLTDESQREKSPIELQKSADLDENDEDGPEYEVERIVDDRLQVSASK
jgi:hypothetical protein